jgi:FAD-dependent urate hydroxylase
MSETRLMRLAHQALYEIEQVAHPRAHWMPERTGPNGQPVLNVLIVGAGQGGAALAFQLARDRVPGVLALDQAKRGFEGPWRTFARMPTLRSPKEFTGPDLGIPSLTYAAWHTAVYGAEHWNDLTLIRTRDWADYLLWVRDTTGVTVKNQTRVTRIEPAGSAFCLFRVTLCEQGQSREVYARKIVLASGQDGVGRWWVPDFIEALPREYWRHSAQSIDFDALRDKRVAVLGAGASAADNAAVALEHGAAEVHMFVRRPKLQRIQPYRWITFAGFLKHLPELDDAWRWRFMQQVLGMRESIPQNTYDRMRKHSNFHLHTARGWSDAQLDRTTNAIRATTDQGPFLADFIIAGTGIDIDFCAKPELASFARHIKTWADAYEPPPAQADERLARYPYLDANGAYQDKRPGGVPYLSSIFDFTIAATLSFGPSGSSINAMTTAVPRLSDAITRTLFKEDIDDHWQDFLAYDTPVFVPGGPDEGK